MAQLQKIIKVTQEQYNILKDGGTVGDYIGIDPNFIYLVEDTGTDANLIKITYDELVALRDNSKLIPGCYYEIIDYETVAYFNSNLIENIYAQRHSDFGNIDTIITYLENTYSITLSNYSSPGWIEIRSKGHFFNLIVVALTPTSLSEDAWACHSDRDIEGYFSHSNLNAWEIKYCLDNDTSRFSWAIFDEYSGCGTDTSDGDPSEIYPKGKGVIYYLKDEFNNECGYDFKNIVYKYGDMTLYTFNASVPKSSGDYDNYSYESYDSLSLENSEVAEASTSVPIIDEDASLYAGYNIFNNKFLLTKNTEGRWLLPGIICIGENINNNTIENSTDIILELGSNSNSIKNTYDVILKQNTCYNEILNSGIIYIGNSADSIRVVSSYKIFLGDDCLYCSIIDCNGLCMHNSYDVQIKSSRDVYACSFDTAITQIPTLNYDFWVNLHSSSCCSLVNTTINGAEQVLIKAKSPDNIINFLTLNKGLWGDSTNNPLVINLDLTNVEGEISVSKSNSIEMLV